MATYLITGASKGIGFELVKQFSELPTSQVGRIFAVTRSEPPQPLRELISKHEGRVENVRAAVDDEASIKKAVGDVKKSLGSHGLDVLVNNAGTQGASPEGTHAVPPEQLNHLFNINVTGPHRVTSAFIPLLEAGAQKKVINVSSTMGSISWAEKYVKAPTPSYKISKAALHMLNKQYALEYAEKGFTFLCVSPGWLKTDLGGDYADFPVEVGVTELKRIILEADKSQNGKFVNIHVPGQEQAWGRYDGKEIEW
ncbi:hypothetical protein LTR86_009851 [Recurvomyces mirabilis]|nr:hypothetical protein LTR86_009851 [Recurvomyces mirabilis]